MSGIVTALCDSRQPTLFVARAGDRYRAHAEVSMKLTLENRGANNVVRSYSSSSIKVGEAVLTTSSIVTADQIIPDWPPRRVDQLRVSHLESILALKPEIVVLGTGAQQKFPSTDVIAAAMTRGIGFEVMDTGAACRTYNVLVSEDRRAALAVLMEEPPVGD
jgi:uncharacterized protein